MIALKTSPLVFGHKILLVFLYIFLLFRINFMTYVLYRQFNFQKVLYICLFFLLLHCLCQLSMKKTLNLVVFLIMSSFVLCDTLSGYLERPNNSDSNIRHCCH